jgi:hypothetical protein
LAVHLPPAGECGRFFLAVYACSFYNNSMKIVLIILLVIILIFVVFGWIRTYKTQHSVNQKNFLAGTVPSPLPDGAYNGTVTGLKTNWRGKTFDTTHSAGKNNFIDPQSSEIVQRYPFKTYTAKGLRDKSVEVERIDYNIAGNPWWLKFILDEIVQTAPDTYLGKIHIRIIPGISFAVGYFHLTK